MNQLDEKLVDRLTLFLSDDYEGRFNGWHLYGYHRGVPTSTHRAKAREIVELIRRVEAEERVHA